MHTNIDNATNNQISNKVSIKPPINIQPNDKFKKIHINKKYDIHIVTFHTNGAPYDDGINLEDENFKFRNYVSEYFESYDVYDTKKCSIIDRKFRDKFLYKDILPEGKHIYRQGSKFGYWSWKPFVIYHKLQQLKEGDILLYHDCNISKYPHYKLTDEVYGILENILETNNNDIIMFAQGTNFRIDKYTKQECLNYFLQDIDTTKFDLGSKMMLRGNRIILRKNKYTISLMKEWLKLCQTELIRPLRTPSNIEHQHDQSILSCMIYRDIYKGVIDKDYPIILINANTLRMGCFRIINDDVPDSKYLA